MPSLCGFLFGVSCKWCDSIGALEYITHVFYMSVSVHAFFFTWLFMNAHECKQVQTRSAVSVI